MLVLLRRNWMLAAASLFGAALAMCLFCVVYLSWWLGASPDEWDALAPPAVPIATTCFIAGAIWHVLCTAPLITSLLCISIC